MKDQDMFNKILKQDEQDEQNEQDEVRSANTADNHKNIEESPNKEQSKPQMPPVKPSTIVIMVIFGMIVALAYFFAPYVTQYLPFGTTIKQELNIQPVGYDYLINNCHSVVIGKSVETYVDAGDLNPDLYYTVHKFEVEQIVYGAPFMDDDKHLETYTLGGTIVQQDRYGRPSKITYQYSDAAEIGTDRVLLFLDDNNNIINEKYGVYKVHKDDLFYDSFSEVYSLDKIKQDLQSRNG